MDVDAPDITSLSLQQEHQDEDEDDKSSDSLPQGSNPNTSSVHENGRMYANDTHPFPNDDNEATRLAIEHQAFTLFLDRKLTMTYLVSHRPLRILEIGCGPGDWAIAAATKHPNTSILAVDISPEIGSAAAGGEMPSNLEFQIYDVRNMPWIFADHSLEFVHMRGLAGSFTKNELASIYEEIYRCLKPEGQLEIADFGAVSMPGSPFPAASASSSTSAPETALTTYNTVVQAALTQSGLVGLLDLSHVRADLVEKPDFRIQRRLVPPVPLGEWSSNRREHRTGKMAAVAMLEGLEPRALRLLTKVAGWRREDVLGLVERVKAEILATVARPSVMTQVVIVRKFGVK